MGNEVRKPVLVECEHVVRVVEERVESFMLLEDGEGPLELHDGVQSVLIGSIAGKTVQITIHVQPGLSDECWQSLPGCPTTVAEDRRSELSEPEEGNVERASPEDRDRHAVEPGEGSSVQNGTSDPSGGVELFGCGGCGAILGERHNLFLVRHREWNVDECSNCGEPYQVGRSGGCEARLVGSCGTELRLPILAWLHINILLHRLGLISYQHFLAMELNVGAGPYAEFASWIVRRLKEEIEEAGEPGAMIDREMEFEGATLREFGPYFGQFLDFAATSGGFSVH